MSRLLHIALASAVAVAAGTCAHPLARIVVLNETLNGSYVRVSEGEQYADFVYEVTTGSRGLSRQIQSPFDGRVELLDATCAVIDAIDLVGADGSVLVTFSGGQPPTQSSVPWADEASLSEVETCSQR